MLDSQVVDPTLSDEKAKERGEFIERLHDDEAHTDRQAKLVADQLAGKAVSFWLCKGYKGPLSSGAFDAWHITAADIHPASFP